MLRQAARSFSRHDVRADQRNWPKPKCNHPESYIDTKATWVAGTPDVAVWSCHAQVLLTPPYAEKQAGGTGAAVVAAHPPRAEAVSRAKMAIFIRTPFAPAAGQITSMPTVVVHETGRSPASVVAYCGLLPGVGLGP